MSELSIFVDESGGQGGRSRYYVLTLVFHNQNDDTAGPLQKYREGLAMRGLNYVPMHAGPLLSGHDDYEGMDLARRKSHLIQFFMLLQHLPVTYASFVYRRSDVGNVLENRMRRDLTDLLFDQLSFFQSFDKVKVYYDNGQEMVASAVHRAVEYVLSSDSYLYRRTRASEYVLEQAADLICSLELTARKYADGTATVTDEKFFGSSRTFKKTII